MPFERKGWLFEANTNQYTSGENRDIEIFSASRILTTRVSRGLNYPPASRLKGKFRQVRYCLPPLPSWVGLGSAIGWQPFFRKRPEVCLCKVKSWCGERLLAEHEVVHCGCSGFNVREFPSLGMHLYSKSCGICGLFLVKKATCMNVPSLLLCRHYSDCVRRNSTLVVSVYVIG